MKNDENWRGRADKERRSEDRERQAVQEALRHAGKELPLEDQREEEDPERWDGMS
jgi:hypothetical protein